MNTTWENLCRKGDSNVIGIKHLHTFYDREGTCGLVSCENERSTSVSAKPISIDIRKRLGVIGSCRIHSECIRLSRSERICLKVEIACSRIPRDTTHIQHCESIERWLDAELLTASLHSARHNRHTDYELHFIFIDRYNGEEFRCHLQYSRRFRSADQYRKTRSVCVPPCVNSCEFDDIRALSIDHINGGGSKEKKQLRSHDFNRLVLERNGVGYQILCANCNWIKRHENDELKRAVAA